MSIESFDTTPLQTAWPAYLYQQYSDDANLQAFVDSINASVQQHIDWFNQHPLALYSAMSGALLDWIGTQLYGIPRPMITVPTPTVASTNNAEPYADAVYGINQFGYGVSGANDAPYVINTDAYMTQHYAQSGFASASKTAPPLTYQPATDDVYRRLIQWNTYRGDGVTFTMRWLKNRVARFLGMSTTGSPPSIEQAANHTIVIGAPLSVLRQSLQSLFTDGYVVVPAQYAYEFSS